MKYPFEDYETAESFIEAIESNPNGHYPIGTSMFWHSGIHIFCDSQKEFEPLIGGKVVCYRISEDYRHVKLPASLGKEELEGKWSDYEGFYDKKGKIENDCADETYPISDCFILLEHSISINGSDFTFYTLYMNLAPACDNPNYKDLNKDGTIHGHAINPDDKEFFVDEIGSLLPAKDKKQIYFDLVVLSKQSIEDFPPQDGKKAFWGIKENTHFYQQKGREKVMALKATLPYEKNPCSFIYIMIAKDDVPDELKKDVKNISETAIHGADGKNYYKVEFRTSQSEEYFVCESDRDACMESLLDFDKWFYFCKESDSIVCDSTELIKDIIEKHDTIIRTAMLMMPIIGIWWTGSKLTWKLLKYVYGRLSSKNDSLEGMLTKLEIRKAVCCHPIEWDKNQFSSLDEKTVGMTVKKRLENEASAIDLWNGGLEKIFSNSPYFYHPIYFINHLEKCGVFEFNPYEGKTLKKVTNRAYSTWFNFDGTNYDLTKTIVSNPGFAPYDPDLFSKYEINGYACINTLFLEKMEYGTKKYSHEGIDFAGKKVVSSKTDKKLRTPIHSFITGIVVKTGNHKTLNYGKHLIISDGNNRLFLLGHLYDYADGIKVGSRIFPGDTVGYVGNSGNCAGLSEEAKKDGSGTHLHLTVYMTETAKSISNQPTGIMVKEINDLLYSDGTYKTYSCEKYKNINPFNYEEKR